VVLVWVATASIVSAGRWLLGQIVDFAKRRFLSPERVLLVGATDASLDAIHAQVTVREGMEVVGRVLLDAESVDIWTALREAMPDTVVLTGELGREAFQDVVHAASVAGSRLLSVTFDRFGSLRPNEVWWGGTRVTELSLPELTAPQLAVKRLVDVVGAALGLVVLAPLFLIIAALIRLTSPGPVVFRQLRIGLGGELFWMYKFRTMQVDADEMKSELTHLNASGDPRLFKIPDDPRVTRLGRRLRAWSLDELPQLVNVIRGEMSLVGPRPFFECDLEDYRDEHFCRLAARPGMTGLWQVRGRSSILDFEEVVRLDLEYVYQWSLVRDAAILLQTLPAVLRRAGAQ
jgi:exopolysaccharide biosynthesis polyprenyl glycosylphosphotransferase